MPKRKPSTSSDTAGLFVASIKRRHPTLVLSKFLDAEALKTDFPGPERDRARQILLHWADLADQGHLHQKETSLDAEFLEKIFGDALGYRSVSESPENYHRERQFTVPGVGVADGALGNFSPSNTTSPTVIIELKGADTDLDHDKFNGRTPVRQCWDYLDQLPECPWAIVSNYVTIRLYHRDKTPRAYEEFTVKDFRDESRFRQFYYLFERHGLLGNKLQKPRALDLLLRTQTRQREVGDELYELYSKQRQDLIYHLTAQHGKTEDQAIHIAQLLIDRIIFVAFCEDRGLLPKNTIAKAYSTLPPFAKVTNPRWQNFKLLFFAIDKGHPRDDIAPYNGNLFKPDPEVDDLSLDDEPWTTFFNSIGDYDFKDEVNVDVLGHLFEQSITELEKRRVLGFFGTQPAAQGQAEMPKSAQRKRFGIYYTPPQFTQFIVERTLGQLIAQRVDPLDDPRAKITALRQLKICDPACGSGAFLIAAYDRLEFAYEDAARALRIQWHGLPAREPPWHGLPAREPPWHGLPARESPWHGLPARESPWHGLPARELNPDSLQQQIPDFILADNLFGVDLSEQSAEITRLALWIRSAQKGRPLSDLSHNIICGNSLVSDPNTHPRALDWHNAFPRVFPKAHGAAVGGFDIVIGNPPWERLKLQEREFFALASPDIASAVNAADRRKLIATLETQNPALHQRYQAALASASQTLDYVRSSNHFPLTGKGDVNTYMLFAELATRIVSPTGRVGLLVPSGIATDDTTKAFFNSLIESQSLIALYDFENREKIFPDVDGRFKFSILLMSGQDIKTPNVDFVFFAHAIEDLDDRHRHIELSAKDLKLLNPNTRTCPIFRSRPDADLTKRVYRNIPILIDRRRKEGGNPWGIRFVRMFDQTNDAELFKTAKDLQDDAYHLESNRWIKRKSVFLPLYEAKMAQAFDHRAASVVIEAGNWMRQGQPEDTSLVEHQNPEFAAFPRYWVDEARVEDLIGPRRWLLAYKDVTSATNQRTMIAAFLPRCAVMNSAPLIHAADSISPVLQCCLLANLNSLAYDFVARQKVGGLHLNFFIVEQLPTLPPNRYAEPCPWDKSQSLADWISARVLELTCTANDMIPLAQAAYFHPTIHRWRDDERAQLRAQLDAAYFILYGLSRDDLEYILSTFQAIANEDESHNGLGPTHALILSAYDSLQR